MKRFRARLKTNVKSNWSQRKPMKNGQLLVFGMVAQYYHTAYVEVTKRIDLKSSENKKKIVR